MGLRARPVAWWELAAVSRADRITDGAARATGARRAYAEACIAARSLIAAGDTSSAAATLEEVVADFPTAIDAHRLLGIALLESNEPGSARRPFEVALEGDPSDLVAQIGIAEVEDATEGAAVAFRAWRRAWELEPGFEPISARIREIRKAQIADGSATAPFTTDGSIDGPIAHTHPSLARARLRAGLHHHAMLDAMEALRQDRSRLDVQLLLAEAWWRSGETEVAHDVAASILEVAPNCVAANLFVAVHRRSVSRDPRQQVERARQADPFDRIAHQLFAGRDVPPIMDDAWSGDQWSASRASYGEWPVVAVMPRAVAIVRAQLAAEKAAAEAAEQARMEAEAEARRRKAAEEAAKKPAAGAFKGTGVISDTPAKPGSEKTDAGDAGTSPPKPSGFKGIGVIAEEEPVFKSKSRRPPGPIPGASGDPVSVSPAPPDNSPPVEPTAAGASPEPQAGLSAPTSASAHVDAAATEPRIADLPSDARSTDMPNDDPSAASSTGRHEPPDDVTPSQSRVTDGAPSSPEPRAAPPPALQSATDPVQSAVIDNGTPANVPTGPVVDSGEMAQSATDGMRGQGTDETSVPLRLVAEGLEVEGVVGSAASIAGVIPASREPRDSVNGSSSSFSSADIGTLRALADTAFNERRFTDAVRAYAALLRRM